MPSSSHRGNYGPPPSKQDLLNTTGLTERHVIGLGPGVSLQPMQPTPPQGTPIQSPQGALLPQPQGSSPVAPTPFSGFGGALSGIHGLRPEDDPMKKQQQGG